MLKSEPKKSSNLGAFCNFELVILEIFFLLPFQHLRLHDGAETLLIELAS